MSDDTFSIAEFERAADALVNGEMQVLRSLMVQHPALVLARSTRAHRATLLHYLGANGVEDSRQKSHRNAVEIGALLLDSGAEVDAVADFYGGSTTLGLVATSIHPKRAGVQIALLELLLQHGAAVDGIAGSRSILLSALHNGRPEAAEFLAQHGAHLDLEGAAGLGRLDLVEALFSHAAPAQAECGFVWACEYGREDVINFLLNQGVDVNTRGNTGLTALHWAIVGGQMGIIQLLLEHGASLPARNAYGGTALGQALWCAANSDPAVEYGPIIEMLKRSGASE